MLIFFANTKINYPCLKKDKFSLKFVKLFRAENGREINKIGDL